MIEPTECESKEELDRFCDSLINIKKEILDVVEGRIDPKDNPLVNSPHTASVVMSSEWKHPYTREQAAYPNAFAKNNKFWPTSSRVDNVYGDRNLKTRREDLVETAVPLHWE